MTPPVGRRVPWGDEALNYIIQLVFNPFPKSVAVRSLKLRQVRQIALRGPSGLLGKMKNRIQNQGVPEAEADGTTTRKP
jgi:hypothetical protein